MSDYKATTFAPVQGFIERSRKLRDLVGASSILSYLSHRIIRTAENSGSQVISPALNNIQQGTPNRILIKGEFTREKAREALIIAWKHLLYQCQQWIEKNLQFEFDWEEEWTKWGNYSWEFFWGEGKTIIEAMEALENTKKSRDWKAINWIGESSSISGADAIAWHGMSAKNRNPKTRNWQTEKKEIEDFYHFLSLALEGGKSYVPEGKFVAPNERLSVPELAKRLVTLPQIADAIPGMEIILKSGQGFQDIQRKPDPDNGKAGQWTGWFMADGDRMGKKLQELAKDEIAGEAKLQEFSSELSKWGCNFKADFDVNLGRVVYAGGDDFLGIIYNRHYDGKQQKGITTLKVLNWLKTVKAKWQEHKQDITLSMGFVWVAGSVPQRDVLQHCREAEKRAKNQGRDRVTIRILFNSGQYVQWTCPWDRLDILSHYRDREGGQNWSHIYSDLGHLKARHAIELQEDVKEVDDTVAKALLGIYFPCIDLEELFAVNLETPEKNAIPQDSTHAQIAWINDLILVGWQLCSTPETTNSHLLNSDYPLPTAHS